jgi:lipoprotein-anchoring transpeptidase ErfK/SrfK
MTTTILKHVLPGLFVAAIGVALGGCSSTDRIASGKDTRNKLLVSVQDQRMLLFRDGKPLKSYPVSTSKFGLGSEPGSYRTPLGRMEVARKIGSGQPEGMVFKARRPTGEILLPNAPGRDPIVSRILWLDGKDHHNRNTFSRMIYIHGTSEEWRLGRPASYGCIRMGMRDVVDLYNLVGEGAEVKVIPGALQHTWDGREPARVRPADAGYLGFVATD